MPQIRFKGITQQQAAALSSIVAKEMAILMDTPEDWFQVEYDPVQVFCNGEIALGEPTVQVWWFDRGRQVQDNVAKRLNQMVCDLGYEYAVVSFHRFEKEAYYEGGEHF